MQQFVFFCEIVKSKDSRKFYSVKLSRYTVYEGRPLKKVATEAVWCGRGSWVQRIGKCIRDFGWHGVSVDDI